MITCIMDEMRMRSKMRHMHVQINTFPHSVKVEVVTPSLDGGENSADVAQTRFSLYKGHFRLLDPSD